MSRRKFKKNALASEHFSLQSCERFHPGSHISRWGWQRHSIEVIFFRVLCFVIYYAAENKIQNGKESRMRSLRKRAPSELKCHTISCLTPFTDVEEIGCNTPAEGKPAPHQHDLQDFMSVALPAFVQGPRRHLNRPSASFREKHLHTRWKKPAPKKKTRDIFEKSLA